MKYFTPFSLKIKPSTVGVEKRVLLIAVLAFLMSIQSLTSPLFQGVASEVISLMISCCSKCPIWFGTFFLNANAIQHSAWGTGATLLLIWSFIFVSLSFPVLLVKSFCWFLEFLNYQKFFVCLYIFCFYYRHSLQFSRFVMFVSCCMMETNQI